MIFTRKPNKQTRNVVRYIEIVCYLLNRLYLNQRCKSYNLFYENLNSEHIHTCFSMQKKEKNYQ